MPDFYIVCSFFYKTSKQARVPTFVWLFRDDATTAKGPGCDEGTNLRQRDFAVVSLMPTREFVGLQFMTVLFHDHTHLLLVISCWQKNDAIKLTDSIDMTDRGHANLDNL